VVPLALRSLTRSGAGDVAADGGSSSGFVGDLADRRLLDLRRALDGLSRAVSRDLTRLLGRHTKSLLDRQFEESRSPYGSPWLPLKRRKGAPLVDTGRLKRSLRVTARDGAIVIETVIPYAAVHQFGADLGTRTQVQPRAATGRFMSRARAARRRRGAVSVSIFRSGGGRIPARPFLPRDGDLPPRWLEDYRVIAEVFLDSYFGSLT